jgi:hypothetical protein
MELKVTKKVETETGVVITLTPVDTTGELSGQLFFKAPVDTPARIGDSYFVAKPATPEEEELPA